MASAVETEKCGSAMAAACDTANNNIPTTTTTTTTSTTVVSSELSGDDEAARAQMVAMIEEVRAKFLEEAAVNPHLYDPTDVDLARTDDWQVERFILRKKSIEASLEMIKGTLQWRHELEMPQLKDTDFPEEFFKIGAMFEFEKDLAGNAVVYLRVRLHRKIKELEKFVKLYMMHIINKADFAMNGKGLTVVFDCSGAGISNLDMDIVWFLVDALIKYYPYGMKNILVHDMPWILSSAWTIIKGWMPEEFRDKVKFTNKKTITEYIAAENLPYYLGGTSKRNYHQVPKGCRPAAEIAPEQGLNEKEVKKMLKTFQPFLDEAEEEINVIQSLS